MDWISVEEKLPTLYEVWSSGTLESTDLVIWGPGLFPDFGIYCREGDTFYWRFRGDALRERFYTGKDITHWIEINPPSET